MKHALKELRAPITPAFGTAIALHAALLFGLGFSFQFAERPARTVAVTIALNPMAVAPDKAQHIAAENQLGDTQAGEQAPETRLVMQTSVTVSKELDSFSGDTPSDSATANDRAPQTEEQQQSVSSVSDSKDRDASRAGSVAARRTLDADYLARWRARVEQVGNALYRGEPPAGDGDVRLLVTVSANGTLENIKVLQTSGNAKLDRAAQDTVVLAAPFPRFSSELAKMTARLEIVRTWQFRTEAVSSD